MALQQLAPLPQPTGLSTLGSALLGASDRIVSRRDQAEALARQDALRADERLYQDSRRQEDREFQERRAQIDREARLQDDLTISRQRAREAGLQALINEDLLTEAQRNDDAAIAQAFQTAQQRGVVDKYLFLIEAGLLKAEEAGDIAKVNAAMNAFGQITAEERTRRQTLQTRGDELATDAARKLASAEAEEQAILRQLQELDQIISTNGEPSPVQVQNEARRLAAADKRGREPSNAEIQARLPEAIQAVRELNLFNAEQRQEGLRRQLEGARAIRAALSSQQNVLLNRGALPTAIPAAPTPAPTTPPPSRAAPMQGFLQTLEREAAASAPPRPSASRVLTPDEMPLRLMQAEPPTAGRPITPSANVFPSTPQWWRTLG